jgi:hypothetical protein
MNGERGRCLRLLQVSVHVGGDVVCEAWRWRSGHIPIRITAIGQRVRRRFDRGCLHSIGVVSLKRMNIHGGYEMWLTRGLWEDGDLVVCIISEELSPRQFAGARITHESYHWPALGVRHFFQG